MTKFNNYQTHQTFTLDPQGDGSENSRLVDDTRRALHGVSIADDESDDGGESDADDESGDDNSGE